jgi:type I restriction enzyme, S subunit
MAGEWRPIHLGEVCTKIGSGATPRGGSDVYLASGPYALIRSQNVYNDGFHHDGLAYIGEQHAHELDNVEVFEGDVLLNITGDSVARACQVDRRVLPARVNQHVAIIRPDPERLHPRFLRYFLVSPVMQGRLLSWAGAGGTRNALTKGMIESFDVSAPGDIQEQRAIAHILGTLDDKIELNRRMSETLEAMARALFKSWFVDFEPVRAKAADLVRQGVLEIGDGYRAKNSELGEPGLPFIRAGNLNQGIETAGAETLRHDGVTRAGSKVSRPGDVAFTSKGTIGRFARVTEFTGPFVYSPQVCFWRSLNRERLHPSILYCWMQSDDLKSQIAAVAGQTDMAPYVSLRDQREMRVPIFPASQPTIAGRIDALLARQALCVEESKTLAELRDVLLPKLVSGEFRVIDTDRFLETVDA